MTKKDNSEYILLLLVALIFIGLIFVAGRMSVEPRVEHIYVPKFIPVWFTDGSTVVCDGTWTTIFNRTLTHEEVDSLYSVPREHTSWYKGISADLINMNITEDHNAIISYSMLVRPQDCTDWHRIYIDSHRVMVDMTTILEIGNNNTHFVR
jgi:hypothetical protein